MGGASQPFAGPVARLEVRQAAHEYDSRDSELYDQIFIFANAEFHLGRQSSGSFPSFDQETISKRHIKIHCIPFDVVGNASIQPLVYAEDLSTNGTYLKRTRTSKKDQPDPRGTLMCANVRVALLGDKDDLWLAPGLFLRYYTEPDFKGRNPRFDQFVEADMEVIRRRYEVSRRLIGEGGHGRVHVAVHRKSQQQLACKIVDLRTEMAQKTLETIVRECDIMQDLDHPNIVKTEKIYYSTTSLFIFQELITGGDLFSYIAKRGPFNIPAIEAAVIIHQILKGLKFLHDQNIVHRDLKPDNILLTSTKAGARLVITDFGEARRLSIDAPSDNPSTRAVMRMRTQVGTLGFSAPEVFEENRNSPEQGYTKAVDLWSVGCITTAVLGDGDTIFADPKARDSREAIMRLSIKCNLDKLDADHHWKQIGWRAKDFIRRTLVLDEQQRLTVESALAHEWFSNSSHADEFEAVYEHAIKNWTPRGKVFKIIEAIDTPRQKMQLNQSVFFSGNSQSAMPTIPEEQPPDSVLTDAASASVSAAEMVPGPSLSYEEAEKENLAPTQLLPTTYSLQQQLVPTQLINQTRYGQQDMSPMPPNATTQRAQIYRRISQDDAVIPDSVADSDSDIDMSIPRPPETSGDSLHEDMTQLSLNAQGNHARLTSSKRQPSFDWDQDLTDAELIDIATQVEENQRTSKRMRIG